MTKWAMEVIPNCPFHNKAAIKILSRLLPDYCRFLRSVAQHMVISMGGLLMKWKAGSGIGRNDLSFKGVIAKGMLSLTVTRFPVLPPTSFGVTLVFTRVQEPPGTEVHGPGPTGVLLREENHLGRVQPVTGIQLASLQQDEAAPYRVTEKKCVCRCTHNT